MKLRTPARRVLYTYLTLALLFVVANFLAPGFARPAQVVQILNLAVFLGIVAAGQTVVIMTGGIDLSVPWVLNFAGILITQWSNGENGALWWAVPAVLLVGAGLGMVNGLFIAYLRLDPMIMTLGLNSLMTGLTLVVTQGTPRGTTPEFLSLLASGDVMGVVRVPLVIWLLITLAMVLLLGYTPFGRQVYAIGNNQRVARLSGVNVPRVLVGVYAFSGLMAAAAAIMQVGFIGRSYLGMGDALLLPSIAAVVIGGTSIMGGQGGYVGTAAGAAILVVLQSLLTVVRIPEPGRFILYGVVILSVLFLYGREARARV